jgi:hypothetical protein
MGDKRLMVIKAKKVTQRRTVMGRGCILGMMPLL